MLLDSETLKIRNQQARYLWRMVDSAEEELPLARRPRRGLGGRPTRCGAPAKEIGKRIDLLQKTARLSNNAIQRDTRALAEIVRLTGWVTRLAAKGYGTDDTESRELLRRIAKTVARELERGRARVSPGSYESMLIAELEKPETDLPDRQEKIAAILLDLVSDAADAARRVRPSRRRRERRAVGLAGPGGVSSGVEELLDRARRRLRRLDPPRPSRPSARARSSSTSAATTRSAPAAASRAPCASSATCSSGAPAPTRRGATRAGRRRRAARAGLPGGLPVQPGRGDAARPGAAGDRPGRRLRGLGGARPARRAGAGADVRSVQDAPATPP